MNREFTQTQHQGSAQDGMSEINKANRQEVKRLYSVTSGKSQDHDRLGSNASQAARSGGKRALAILKRAPIPDAIGTPGFPAHVY